MKKLIWILILSCLSGVQAMSLEMTARNTADVSNTVIQNISENYTDPFHQEKFISFELLTRAVVYLDVYTPRGEKVCRIVSEEFEIGEHTVIWDGKNSRNETVQSGVYVLKFKVDDFEKSWTLALLQ